MTKQWILAIVSVQSRDLAVSDLPHAHRQVDVCLHAPFRASRLKKLLMRWLRDRK